MFTNLKEKQFVFNSLFNRKPVKSFWLVVFIDHTTFKLEWTKI